MDNWCITNTAPDPVAAHAFLNFFMDPKIAGKEPIVTYYASCISAARPYIDPSIINNPSIYPPQSVTDKLEAQKDLGDGIKLRDQIWTEFKSAQVLMINLLIKRVMGSGFSGDSGWL